MFRLIDNSAASLVEIGVDGQEVEVPAGVSLAAALFYLEAIPVRETLLSGSPRAPFCMMGVCFECLVEVDGIANQRACQVTVRPGMQVRRQRSASVEEVI